MTAPRKELLIWLTNNAEAIAVGDEAPEALPEYVREQYRLRRGWTGAGGKLWVPEKFGERHIADWPDTFVARMIREGTSAGIVFASPDLKLFKGVPGVLTDFQLRVVVI